MTDAIAGYGVVDDREYRRRVRAWSLYDWANSAFATTILAAVLPVYYSQVAGRTLGSAAQATAFWTATLSISLIIVAILSPILGTISDLKRGKKKFLAASILIGALGVSLLVFVGTGDWLIASAAFVIARIGFATGNVFYEALLPHVAREGDLDRVSALGYAVGYLGGGLLLAINIVMIFTLGNSLGTRLSFLSVAIWWIVFSIPILRRVPEPPAAVATEPGGLLSVTFNRLGDTFRHLRSYRELLKFLIAYLIYNDGIGTIIGVAVIYGAELGFGSIDLIAAILLVQFVGIPFSLVFGRIPSKDESKRAFFLAFIVWNLIMLPLVGIGSQFVLGEDITGTRPPAYEDTAGAVGEGDYSIDSPAVVLQGTWETNGEYARTGDIGATYALAYNGTTVRVHYSEGPDRSEWAVLIDGEAVIEDEETVVIDGYNSAVHEGVDIDIAAGEAGEHLLEIVNTGEADEASSGTAMVIGEATVRQPPRTSDLLAILGLLFIVEVVGLAVAVVVAGPLFSGLADTMTTKRTIVLSLIVYSAIAVWGFFLDSVVEFWFLAFMVAVVQGGSQALSRSLYASMAPKALSGEFFGFFSVMSKFSAIFGPLLFVAAVTVFGSSRPAVLGLVVFFVVGIYLLTRVDETEGRRVAREADEAATAAGIVESG
ncbi:MAG TPA: MFS transporter [Acidimicrobiia bacterium]|nr:MFS transporter [Acidimicrobiia bacterium]